MEALGAAIARAEVTVERNHDLLPARRAN